VKQTNRVCGYCASRKQARKPDVCIPRQK